MARRRIMFWLDEGRTEEFELIKFIKRLKRNRKFHPTVRDGLRLMQSLEKGDTTVLKELFPGILATPQPTPDTDRLDDLMSRMEQMLKNGNGVRVAAHGAVEIKTVQESATPEKVLAGALGAVSSFL
jgi:hypothetical protein